MKTALALIAMTLLGAAASSAQSNDTIDRLLDERSATFGDAAYVVLTSVGLIPDDFTPEEAAAAVPLRGLMRRTPVAGAPVTLGQVCFLVMRAEGIPGGLLYTLFPGPRYAARELASLGLLKGNTHPGRTVSGEEVLWIVGAAMNWLGAGP